MFSPPADRRVSTETRLNIDKVVDTVDIGFKPRMPGRKRACVFDSDSKYIRRLRPTSAKFNGTLKIVRCFLFISQQFQSKYE